MNEKRQKEENGDGKKGRMDELERALEQIKLDEVEGQQYQEEREEKNNLRQFLQKLLAGQVFSRRCG